MRIAIFGVGAVGGYFGGKLAQTEHDVTFIARGKHLAAIREHGLRVDSENGDFVAHPARATDDPAEIGEVDVVVLATKAWQVRDAAHAMQPLVGENTMVLPLLNGVEAPMQLAAVLGDACVLGGFCRVLSRVEAPGHIVQGGTPPFVAFGELDSSVTQRIEQLAELFESAGVNVQRPPNIRAAMWQKLLFIASFGGLGAVTRMPAGVLRSIPETHSLLREAMQEVKDVAAARGIEMVPDAVEKGLAQVANLPHEGTASMQRDIMNGYPSELDAQNGAVVRLGEDVHIETPVHRFIYHSLMPSERKARGQLPQP